MKIPGVEVSELNFGICKIVFEDEAIIKYLPKYLEYCEAYIVGLFLINKDNKYIGNSDTLINKNAQKIMLSIWNDKEKVIAINAYKELLADYEIEINEKEII